MKDLSPSVGWVHCDDGESRRRMKRASAGSSWASRLDGSRQDAKKVYSRFGMLICNTTRCVAVKEEAFTTCRRPAREGKHRSHDPDFSCSTAKSEADLGPTMSIDRNNTSRLQLLHVISRPAAGRGETSAPSSSSQGRTGTALQCEDSTVAATRQCLRLHYLLSIALQAFSGPMRSQ